MTRNAPHGTAGLQARRPNHNTGSAPERALSAIGAATC